MDRDATSLPSSAPITRASSPKRLNVFERFLSLWVGLCMVVGVVLGLAAPGMMQGLRSLEFGAGSQIKGIERVVPMLKFSLRGVEMRVHGVRQHVPPRMEGIDYEIVVDTDEPDRRLELLHDNVKKYGTVFNTVAPGTDLKGVLVRATSHRS